MSLADEPKTSPVLPKAGRRLRNGHNKPSRFYRFKEFFGFGNPDALPIGVYEGPSGGNVFLFC